MSFYFTCAFMLSLFFTFFTCKSKPNFFLNLWQYTKVKFELKFIYEVSIYMSKVSITSFYFTCDSKLSFFITCDNTLNLFYFNLWDRGFSVTIYHVYILPVRQVVRVDLAVVCPPAVQNLLSGSRSRPSRPASHCCNHCVKVNTPQSDKTTHIVSIIIIRFKWIKNFKQIKILNS